MRQPSRILIFAVAALAAVAALSFAILVSLFGGPTKFVSESNSRTQGELIRYAKLRLLGHPKLEAVLIPSLNYFQTRIERPLPAIVFPHLGKGQQNQTLPQQQYSLTGQPIEANAAQEKWLSIEKPPFASELVTVSNAQELTTAVDVAVPGQTIQLRPGKYRISRQLSTRNPGTKDLPIRLTVAQPGQAMIEFATTEGFNVSQPFWVFENLHIRGVCAFHYQCEHAFHVVGKASSTVIRNNLIENFNAHLKINGQAGDWPDQGLIQFNTITNNEPRKTDTSVTLVDLVGANRWVLADNVISNFVKDGSNRISYGAFMKGTGRGGRMERNLVICTTKEVSQPGLRVGLSFGGGGTGKAYCRDRRCEHEHADGIAANNVVAHCNDSGIDANNARQILIAHNTLINTAGIAARRESTSVRLYANLIEGKIQARDKSTTTLEANEIVTMSKIFVNPDAFKFEFLEPPANILSSKAVPFDFCGVRRRDGTLPGAFAEPIKNVLPLHPMCSDKLH